ncbi:MULTISPECIES: TIGR01440 family protein [Bacillus]|uniref:TIGR01440 family protein n=1 Tax=Bacillus TaxID=1386 RepID=UPI0003061207|nr:MULTISPECIES: TIGR01440 family protein [Bacillus]
MTEEQMSSIDLEEIRQQLHAVLTDLKAHSEFHRCKLLVIGCSTSEVIGKHIGTSGTMQVAEVIYQTVMNFIQEHKLFVAFQCCEHLNRALVMEATTMNEYRYEEVSVTPVRTAGGALASYAYRHLNNPVVVEHIVADAGVDIGDTFIGMHIKHVAVPVRPKSNIVGKAHVTMAVSRPKLIGGVRAVYELKEK